MDWLITLSTSLSIDEFLVSQPSGRLSGCATSSLANQFSTNRIGSNIPHCVRGGNPTLQPLSIGLHAQSAFFSTILDQGPVLLCTYLAMSPSQNRTWLSCTPSAVGPGLNLTSRQSATGRVGQSDLASAGIAGAGFPANVGGESLEGAGIRADRQIDPERRARRFRQTQGILNRGIRQPEVLLA